jgi:hypothetical protein
MRRSYDALRRVTSPDMTKPPRTLTKEDSSQNPSALEGSNPLLGLVIGGPTRPGGLWVIA